MKQFRLEVRVKPRPGLLDPEGKAIQHALESLGYPGIASVRVGKVIDLDIAADDSGGAVERGRELCRKLLANPVTEDFEITVVPEGNGGGEGG